MAENKVSKKRLRIPAEKLLLSIREYGNTSSASIPLTITHHFSNLEERKNLRLLLTGFGVGYSWGGAILNIDEKIIIPAVIKL